MVRLISHFESETGPVRLSRRQLETFGWTRRQASYDQEVLVRLSDRDRVLQRWRGRGSRPDCWAINRDLRQWRRVPWITPRRQVLAAFLHPDPDNPVSLWPKTAASAVSLWPILVPIDPLTDPDTTPERRAMLKLHRAATRRIAGTMRTPVGHDDTPPPAPDNSLLISNHSLPNPPSSEGVSDVLAQLTKVVHCPVTGRLRERVVNLVASYPNDVDELVRLIATLSGYRTMSGAVEALEAMAAMASRPLTRQASATERAANLRQRIANLKAFDPDSEHIAELETELESLGRS